VKISDGQPDDPADDVAGDAWAGVLPIMSRWGVAIGADDLRSGIAMPDSVRAMVGTPTDPTARTPSLP
jgi:hypothetical protein